MMLTARKKGVALVWSVAMMFLVMIIALSVATLSIREGKMAQGGDLSIHAYAASRSGIEVARLNCPQSAAEPNFDSGIKTISPDQEVKYHSTAVWNAGASACFVESAGEAGRGSRRITRKLETLVVTTTGSYQPVNLGTISNPQNDLFYYDNSNTIDRSIVYFEDASRAILGPNGNVNYSPFKMYFDIEVPDVSGEIAYVGTVGTHAKTGSAVNSYLAIKHGYLVGVEGGAAGRIRIRKISGTGAAYSDTVTSLGLHGRAANQQLRIYIEYTGSSMNVVVKDRITGECIASTPYSESLSDYYFNYFAITNSSSRQAQGIGTRGTVCSGAACTTAKSAGAVYVGGSASGTIVRALAMVITSPANLNPTSGVSGSINFVPDSPPVAPIEAGGTGHIVCGGEYHQETNYARTDVLDTNNNTPVSYPRYYLTVRRNGVALWNNVATATGRYPASGTVTFNEGEVWSVTCRASYHNSHVDQPAYRIYYLDISDSLTINDTPTVHSLSYSPSLPAVVGNSLMITPHITDTIHGNRTWSYTITKPGLPDRIITEREALGGDGRVSFTPTASGTYTVNLSYCDGYPNVAGQLCDLLSPPGSFFAIDADVEATAVSSTWGEDDPGNGTGTPATWSNATSALGSPNGTNAVLTMNNGWDDSGYIRLNMGNSYDKRNLSIWANNSASGGNDAYRNYRIRVSDDGIYWTTVYSHTGVGPTTRTRIDATIPSGVYTRFVEVFYVAGGWISSPHYFYLDAVRLN